MADDQAAQQSAQTAQAMRAEVQNVSRINLWDVANMSLVIQKLVVMQQQAEAEKAELQARLDALTQPRPVPQPEIPQGA